MAPDQHDSDREFDDLVRSWRRSFITANDAQFDFRSGLADVYERAGREGARVPAGPASGGGGPAADAVAAVCGHIDEFVAVLGQVLLAETPQYLIGSHVQRAAEVLLQVREHVADGSMSPAVVADVFAVARDALGRADLIVTAERGESLDQALSASRLLDHPDGGLSLAALLRRLEDEVADVLAPAGPGPDPAARSRRQRNDSQPAKRRAEGSGR